MTTEHANASSPKREETLWQAVLGPDEEVAAGLERSAGRARARGGSAAAAAFLQHAVELIPEPADQARRALESADAKHEAGASEAALELMAVAAVGPSDARQRARLQLSRARIAFYLTRGRDVPGMRWRPGRSARWTPRSPARPTCTRSMRRSSPARSATNAACLPTSDRNAADPRRRTPTAACAET
nr:hypothetical protein GCM10020063_092010 [Dactylosporangium thailandense]